MPMSARARLASPSALVWHGAVLANVTVPGRDCDLLTPVFGPPLALLTPPCCAVQVLNDVVVREVEKVHITDMTAQEMLAPDTSSGSRVQKKSTGKAGVARKKSTKSSDMK